MYRSISMSNPTWYLPSKRTYQRDKVLVDSMCKHSSKCKNLNHSIKIRTVLKFEILEVL